MTAGPPNDEVRAGWKLAWLEAVADDRGVTGLTLKVAVKLSQRAERDGVVRTASQAWIAKRIGVEERTARRCIDRLLKRGHIKRCGVGARGRAAEYRLVKPGGDAAGLRTDGDTRTIETRTPQADTRTLRPEYPDISVQKHAPRSPPLPIFQEDSLAHAALPAPIGASSDTPEGRWRAIKERLAASSHFGKDKVAAWLEQLKIGSVGDGEVVLVAPSKFMANRNQADHAEILCREWQAADPAIERVRVTWRSQASPDHPPAERYVPLRERLAAEAVAKRDVDA